MEDVLERARQLGFLGPGPTGAHLAHGRAYARFLGPAEEVVDLGSGGGVPGLVLAVHEPVRRFTLVDAARRRVAFLQDAVERLDLAGRVVVLGGRAEDLARRLDLRERFDAVVARSFGPPAVTAECASGLVAVGGRVVVSDPPGPTTGRWPQEGLAAVGLRLATRVDDPALTVLDKVAPVPDRFPRRTGVPAKRPLWVVPRGT